MRETANYFDKQIGRGGLEFSRPQSRINEFIKLEDAKLDDIIASEYFIPRTIDIARITTASRELTRLDHGNNTISIADLGGGKGTLDKLIADYLYEQGKLATITDVDIDQEKLLRAQTAHLNTPGLSFSVADISKIQKTDFKTTPQLIIASWIHGGQESTYKNAIGRIKPLGVLEIKDFDRETTEDLHGLENYSRITSWYGPTTTNIGYNHSHFNNQYGSTQGDNIFTLLLRNDLLENRKMMQEAIQNTTTSRHYSWEDDLQNINPPFDYPKTTIPD